MLAKDIMSESVACISAGASVLEAAALLTNTRTGALPVVDEQGALVGIVSEADIIPHVLLGGETGEPQSVSHRVADVMTRDVVFVTKDGSLKAAIELMVARHLKLVPVCDGGIVVGTLNRADIVRLIASHSSAASPVRSQDDALRRKVLEATRGHRWSLAQRFDVVVNDGEVHLWGVVPSQGVHNSYCEAAQSVPQARSVTSHMHVMPHGVRMSNLMA